MNSLTTFLDESQETIATIASRAECSEPVIREMYHGRRTPLLNTAIRVERATEGKVCAIDLVGTIEGYSPIDPEWRKWWESRPGAEQRAAAADSVTPERKPRARVARVA